METSGSNRQIQRYVPNQNILTPFLPLRKRHHPPLPTSSVEIHQPKLLPLLPLSSFPFPFTISFFTTGGHTFFLLSPTAVPSPFFTLYATPFLFFNFPKYSLTIIPMSSSNEAKFSFVRHNPKYFKFIREFLFSFV